MNMFRAFMELDNIYESASENALHEGLSRQELIANLKALGKNYNFDKWSDTQLYRMWEKAEAEKEEQDALKTLNNSTSKKPICNECGQELTDGGFCPNCDDGKDDLINESQENNRTKSVYNCTECGYEVEMYDDEFDYCCPNCHDHHGGFGKCEEALAESGELSTEHAVASVVDRVKEVYEAGLFNKLPIGRDKAFTIDISGPDKERLAGYFKKQPEFNYELNNDSGIISHEFISDKYDIEVFDTFIQMYRLPQNESLVEMQEKDYIKKNGDYIIKNDSGGYTAFNSHNVYLGHIEEEDPKEAQFKFEKNKFDECFVEGMFDTVPNRNNWVTVQSSQPNTGKSAPQVSSSNNSPKTFIVTIVHDGHKLRARADDGIHGEANTAFPNNLRTHEGQQYEVDTLIWNGKNYRVSGAIRPVISASSTQNINENFNKETNEMNFASVLEELDRLYEADEMEAEVGLAEEDPTSEAPIEEEVPAQLILECAKCGALVIKDEADVTVDEATDLANVEDTCAFCEETEGFKILGVLSPYKDESMQESLLEKQESHIIKELAAQLVNVGDRIYIKKKNSYADVKNVEHDKTKGLITLSTTKGNLVLKEKDPVDVVDTKADDLEKSKNDAVWDYGKTSNLEESVLTEGKFLDTVKKVATRVGADVATCVRGLSEISDVIANIGNDDEYKSTKLTDFMEYVENKAVLKALINGNEKVLNSCTKDDIEDLVQDIEDYKKAKTEKPAKNAE